MTKEDKITLILKMRPNGNNVIVPAELLKTIYTYEDETIAKNTLWNQLKPFAESGTVHDKFWLTMIIDWTPQQGIPLTEMAKWLPLAKKVNAIDDMQDNVGIDITQKELDYIWGRMKNPAFTARTSAPLLGFIEEFLTVTGLSFETKEKDE